MPKFGDGSHIFSSTSNNMTPPSSPIHDIEYIVPPLDTKEQVEAFKEERRRNFPTQKNIQRKRLAEAAGLISSGPSKIKCFTNKHDVNASSSITFSALKEAPLLRRLLHQDVDMERRVVLAALKFLVDKKKSNYG
ncbi:hypothetical protein P9112_010939 [Eukaryota sp. TZLM1-RC]